MKRPESCHTAVEASSQRAALNPSARTGFFRRNSCRRRRRLLRRRGFHGDRTGHELQRHADLVVDFFGQVRVVLQEHPGVLAALTEADLAAPAGKPNDAVGQGLQPYEGWTTLTAAAWRGQTEVVSALIDRGVELDAPKTGRKLGQLHALFFAPAEDEGKTVDFFQWVCTCPSEDMDRFGPAFVEMIGSFRFT